jgi:hypothetical protein
MMGIIYGTQNTLEKCRSFARSVGNQLQQKAFDHLQSEDLVNLESELLQQSLNVDIFVTNLDKSQFEFVRTLGSDSNLFQRGKGCLVFLKLLDSIDLKLKHRKLIDMTKQKMSDKGLLIHIRAGFGYHTTCLRSYEDNALNQPDQPLYIRISIGTESPDYFVILATIINQTCYEI